MAKQDLLIELFHSGAWQDVTTSVYVRDSITISRGRADETSQPSPTRASLTFDNRDGRFNPENPTSSLFGLIGRNTPIRITVAGKIRFYGEVSSWTPQRAIDDGDAWTLVTAAGITRRLGQGADPLNSAYHRFIVNSRVDSDLVAYWPLNEGESAVRGMPAFGTIGAMTPDPSFSEHQLVFGKNRAAPWLDTGISVDEDSRMQAQVNGMDPSTDEYVVGYVKTQPAGTESRLIIEGNTEDGGAKFEVTFQGAAPRILVSFFYDEALISSTETLDLPQVADGAMHHIRFQAFQSGADISWAVDIDGIQVVGNTETTRDLTGISLIALRFQRVTGESGPMTWGDVAIWDTRGGNPVPDLAETVAAAYGHGPHAGTTAGIDLHGEPAARRVSRLAAEEGIAFTRVGDFDDSALLGPQRTETLLAVLAETGEADLSFVTDSRPVLGILNRSRVSTYNQTPVLALDYLVREEVAPPLEPVIDDQATRNDITVTRRDGASRTETLDIGSLSTLAPPDGVGRYDTSVTVNVAADGHLGDQAGWRLHLGTSPGARYPQVTVDLDAKPALTAAVAAVDLGDRITIGNMPPSISPDLVSLIVQGYTETIGSHRRMLVFNCSPEPPWVVGRYAALVEGFEDAELDVSIGQGTSDLPWVRTNSLAHLGKWSLRSGAIGDSQTSDAVVTVPTGATTVRFFYRVDSESSFDFFRVLVDANQVLEASGNVDWTESDEFDVSAATTVTFRYIKDISASTGTDASYIDDLMFGELAPGPDEPSRYSPVDSTTTAAFTSGTDTALTVEDNTGDLDLWSTTPDLPFDVRLAGVRLRVTAVGALVAGLQTLTVEQAPVNGVTKTIPAGTPVELWQPATYAL